MTKKILKLICGAGNEDFEEIEKLSFIYASAGFNMIDTSAKIKSIQAVKSGIKKAGKENEVSVCVSIGLGEDIHLSKAVIDNKKCIKCKNCMKICERNAIIFKDEEMLIDEKRCIGCSKCIKACSHEAIMSCHKNNSPREMLLAILGENIDCVEFHCTSENESLILNSWKEIKSIYNGQLSICLNRLKFGDEKIINLLKQMVNNDKNIIIQADGNPMSGNLNDYKSNLQTVAFGELIRNSQINAILILSGGTNEKTSEFAKICDVNINGAAIGSFARKLVKEYTNTKNFWDNETIIKKAVKKAETLSKSLLLYL